MRKTKGKGMKGKLVGCIGRKRKERRADWLLREGKGGEEKRRKGEERRGSGRLFRKESRQGKEGKNVEEKESWLSR